MSTMQRVIKYLAIALAAGIILAMIGGILGIIQLVAGVASLGEWIDGIDPSDQLTDRSFGPYDGIETLKLDIGAADIYIRVGDELKAETDNSYIEVTARGDTLTIRERNHISVLEGSTLVLTIPEGMEFSDVEMTTGAGRITCEALHCRDLDLELGAGMAELNGLTVTGEADIDGGAGQIIIGSGALNDLNFDMGVGEALITTRLTGRSKITAGIGNLELTLLGSQEDYTIRTEQGMGRIVVDDRMTSGNQTTGSGEHRVEINGGIGNIDVEFHDPI